jgi:hypothetical protein
MNFGSFFYSLSNIVGGRPTAEMDGYWMLTNSNVGDRGSH